MLEFNEKSPSDWFIELFRRRWLRFALVAFGLVIVGYTAYY